MGCLPKSLSTSRTKIIMAWYIMVAENNGAVFDWNMMGFKQDE